MSTQPNRKTNADLYTKWHNDPANWQLGFIYRNQNDKRILVPKRWGIGFTLNFGNSLSAILLIILIAVPVLVAFIFS